MNTQPFLSSSMTKTEICYVDAHLFSFRHFSLGSCEKDEKDKFKNSKAYNKRTPIMEHKKKVVKYDGEEISEDLLNRTGCDRKVQRGCD